MNLYIKKLCLNEISLHERKCAVHNFLWFRDHTEPLFQENGLLKISDINKFVLREFMYRWYTKQIPCLFHRVFQQYAVFMNMIPGKVGVLKQSGEVQIKLYSLSSTIRYPKSKY